MRKALASRAQSYAEGVGSDPLLGDEYNSRRRGMNKRKRVAIAKHRRKKRKLKARAAQASR